MAAAVTAIESVNELDLDEQKTLARIRHYISHPPVQSRVFTLTPMICETLVNDYNQGNRPDKPRNIARYSDDMAADNWPLTGDTIKFSNARRLRDGQNRLKACIRCGVSFQTHMVFGIDDEAFDRLDQGRNRNGADVLAIAGYPNAVVLSAAVRWVHLIESDRAKARDTYPPAEILRLLRERYDPALPGFVQQGRAISKETGQPHGFIVAILYLIHRANPTKAADFTLAWETGKFDGKFKAIGLLHSRLASIRASTSGRVHDVVRAALIILAWNIYVAGRKGRSNDFAWDLTQPFPTIAAC
jgi:hypothetical protein